MNMFNPPAEIVAARDHIMHVVYSFLQPSRILDKYATILKLLSYKFYFINYNHTYYIFFDWKIGA